MLVFDKHGTKTIFGLVYCTLQ